MYVFFLSQYKILSVTDDRKHYENPNPIKGKLQRIRLNLCWATRDEKNGQFHEMTDIEPAYIIEGTHKACRGAFHTSLLY